LLRLFRSSSASRAPAPAHRPLGELLIERGLIDRETLDWALARQRETGERLGRVLLAAGKVRRLDLRHVLADQWGLPFIDLLHTPIDADLAQRFVPSRLVAEGWIPVRRDGGRVVVATCEPLSEEIRAELCRELGGRIVIDQRTTTTLDIERAVLSVFKHFIVEHSTVDLLTERPDLSAASGYSWEQKAGLVIAAVAIVAALVWNWAVTLGVLLAGADLIFLGAILFKVVASLLGIGARRRFEQPIAEEDYDLPRYTILVPVYREANVIGDLMRNLGALDYPAEKLEILVLLESDDEETIAAARAARPPETVRLVVVPDAQPKTKPKACNVGLFLATGEHLVIYDAEDRPEATQLRKAVAAFRRSGPQTVCVQARLFYWNAGHNLLTRMFGLEYGYWFGTMLPGLDRLRLPIPLGGTSNHFRVDALRDLGGWDPHNVTEDADLGIRAAVEGYRVEVIDSWTDEEACSQVRPWIRQRTRWIKGYMQTVIVHSRSPIRLARMLGPRDTLGFALLIAGTPLTFLLAPVLWVSTLALLVLQPQLPIVDHGWMAWVALGDLLVGNAAMIFLCALAAVRDRGWRWAPLALLNPLYWVLHSWASWRALIQLIRNPFLWEKTPHGLHEADPAPSADVAQDGSDEVAAVRERRRVGVLGAGHEHEVVQPERQQAG
jgi:cellulose synthase/poly-beta-1,6-N-acetylglucosamine synthase-like glycosyltransferase